MSSTAAVASPAAGKVGLFALCFGFYVTYLPRRGISVEDDVASSHQKVGLDAVRFLLLPRAIWVEVERDGFMSPRDQSAPG